MVYRAVKVIKVSKMLLLNQTVTRGTEGEGGQDGKLGRQREKLKERERERERFMRYLVILIRRSDLRIWCGCS